MAFQPGNRRQSVFAPRAIKYYSAVTAAASLILNLPRTFRPFSPILATLPPYAPAGISITAVKWLPRLGVGQPFRAQLTMVGSGTTDLLLTQC